MYSSDQDMSESSNVESPLSQMDSPISSPSHQVPQLATGFDELSFAENSYKNGDGGMTPFLRITEQPQDYFRFRYKSEMVGTHGCLLGKTTCSNKSKSHPTVELVNYTGRALIRCRLAQDRNPKEHPHKLLEDDQDRDVSAEVPEQGSYKVGFAGMGIIHTAKKDVAELLYKKYAAMGTNINAKELKVHCENEAKAINLNIVRLKFTAHNIRTGDLICPPVFSEPIHNMKSAATNDLKICRVSKLYGKPDGGEDVFILVEKVNKKNIAIRFVEVDENDKIIWSAGATFLQNDVHHQYAIVFRTPPYRELDITSDVNVFFELQRPSDGRTSERKAFTYRPEAIKKQHSQSKKRKNCSSYSSIESYSGGSVKSDIDLPLTVEQMQHKFLPNCEIKMDHLPLAGTYVPQLSTMNMTNDLGEALLDDIASSDYSHSPMSQHMVNPLLAQTSAPGPPQLNFNSEEFYQLLKNESSIPDDQKRKLCDSNFLADYMNTSFGNEELHNTSTSSMGFINSLLVTDSGRAKAATSNKPQTNQRTSSVPQSEGITAETLDKSKVNNEYGAYYNMQDGNEVKKIVKELCGILRNKTGYKRQDIKNKLNRLLELRLSNGDNFLHMTLCSNVESFEYVVKVISNMKMTRLLNLGNDSEQTVLHLAVINDMPRIVAYLIENGCDPMAKDLRGDTAIHYAVKLKTCLEPLLKSIKDKGINCDLNCFNNEKQTPLHLAASCVGDASGAGLLLASGASYYVTDSQGRTPLHVAAYDGRLHVVRSLLEYVRTEDIDIVDGQGYTALQIVCDRNVQENSLDIVKLLLQKNADPSKHEGGNEPALKLARGKPQIQAVLQSYAADPQNDDIKSEPEDDFESADEGDSPAGFQDMWMYADGVSTILDESGGWCQLAKRLHLDSLVTWYSNTRSPTKTLLKHLKECESDDDNMSSMKLASILEDIGETRAAEVIKRLYMHN